MPNITVRFHRLASREYRRAVSWYAQRSLGAARRFRGEVIRLIQRIELDPNAGTIYRGPYRWLRVRRLPYLLYFGPSGPGEIMIYAVAHAGRRSGYWIRRTRP
jgi:plasmid stabilization system protein ParE